MEKRTALITGSSRGIGRQIAITFAKNGYNIIVNYKQNVRAAEETASIIAGFSRVIIVKADISDTRQVDNLYHISKQNFGFVDTVVNNAGIAQGKLFIDHTDEEYYKIMDTNFKGVFNVCRRFLPDMLSNRFGRIINMSSIWGITGAAMEVLYSSSKAAIIGLTKALSKESAPNGVTVNAIAPGAIDTDMLRSLGSETLERVRQNIMVGRLGKPEDIAAAALFLASKSAEFVSGQVLGVNGEYVGMAE